MSGEIETGYRCGACGEQFWSKNDTTVTVRRKEHADESVITTIWEFHLCDECLRKMVMTHD